MWGRGWQLPSEGLLRVQGPRRPGSTAHTGPGSGPSSHSVAKPSPPASALCTNTQSANHHTSCTQGRLCSAWSGERGGGSVSAGCHQVGAAAEGAARPVAVSSRLLGASSCLLA